MKINLKKKLFYKNIFLLLKNDKIFIGNFNKQYKL